MNRWREGRRSDDDDGGEDEEYKYGDVTGGRKTRIQDQGLMLNQMETKCRPSVHPVVSH